MACLACNSLSNNIDHQITSSVSYYVNIEYQPGFSRKPDVSLERQLAGESVGIEISVAGEAIGK